MGADHADAGRPMPAELVARSSIRYHKFRTATRQISMRNTGVNTLWVSFDRENWFDVACGTSWDDRVVVLGFWHCTQVGITAFVANGLTMNHVDMKVPEATEEELG